MVTLVNQKMQVLVDTTNDFNLIWKNIAIHQHLRLFFSARAKTQAGNTTAKIYWRFCEGILITNTFGLLVKTWIPLIPTDIGVNLFLGVHLLQSHNLILKFDLMTIEWKDFRPTVSDNIDSFWDFNSLF